MEERKVNELILQNKDDREAVALALYRAGYTVRERRRKDSGKNHCVPGILEVDSTALRGYRPGGRAKEAKSCPVEISHTSPFM